MGIKGDENAMVTAVMPPIYIYTLWMRKQAFKEYISLCNSTLDSTPVANTTYLLSLTAVLMLEVLSAWFQSH